MGEEPSPPLRDLVARNPERAKLLEGELPGWLVERVKGSVQLPSPENKDVQDQLLIKIKAALK